jgi:hypothetical protein
VGGGRVLGGSMAMPYIDFFQKKNSRNFFFNFTKKNSQKKFQKLKFVFIYQRQTDEQYMAPRHFFAALLATSDTAMV